LALVALMLSFALDGWHANTFLALALKRVRAPCLGSNHRKDLMGWRIQSLPFAANNVPESQRLTMCAIPSQAPTQNTQP
jgi:hypothetical protein